MKNHYLWIIVVIIAFIAGGLFFGKGDFSSILPLALVLICPLMMLFMMGRHKHK